MYKGAHSLYISVIIVLTDFFTGHYSPTEKELS